MDYLGAEESNTGRMRVAAITPEQISVEQRVRALYHGKTPAFQERYADYLNQSKEIVDRIGLDRMRVDASCTGGEMILVS